MSMREQIAAIIVEHWCPTTGNIDQVVISDAIIAALPDYKKQQARIEQLEAFIDKAFEAHSNLDLDIEALQENN
jgi:hypothetical protein